MIRITQALIVVAVSLASLASANVFSTEFGLVTRVQCFGTELNNNANNNFSSDFDICVAGVIVGAIAIIAGVPLLGGFDGFSAKKRVSQDYNQFYPTNQNHQADVHRRHGLNPKNPADTVSNQAGPFQQRIGGATSVSLKERISRAFDSIAARLKTNNSSSQEKKPEDKE